MKGKKIIGILLLLLSNAAVIHAQVILPRLVRDSMILQRDVTIKIWGWAAKGEKLTIRFNNKTFKTSAGIDRKWFVWLPPMKAGGPYTMTITGSNKIILKEILIGDVWICAGQSNMVHQLSLHNITYAEDIAKANYPQVRQFLVPNINNLQGPQDDLPTGYWKPATTEFVPQFSAVAYFFARKIYEKYHVPIGLINASVGGTPIEAWTSEEGLKEFPDVSNAIRQNKDTAYVNYTNRKAKADNDLRPKEHDNGLNEMVKWYDTTYTPTGWRNIIVPGYWEDQGIKNLDGIVWYRKEIDIPLSMTGIEAKVFLGRIVDADFLYINGVLAGNTSYQYPQRRYTLPPGLLKAGKNIFTIRVTNNNGKGGFVPDKPYYIEAGGRRIDLKGNWEYKVGDVFAPFHTSAGISFQNQPTALFNAMVAPLTNYAIKGILWYQGETNTSKAGEYARLLPVMINDWRHQWKKGDIPFLYVQLPNFMDANYLPGESDWALLREGQLKTLSVPNTAMAVAIDLGEWNDIHPDNKKDVGTRLAIAAEKIAYGDNIIYSGPLYQSSTVEGNKIAIHFSNTASGLITKDGQAPAEFAIAGIDKKFIWAKAKIDGDKIIVWSDDVQNPMFVRYAWADNPVNPNLYNKEGLPASPFRTDK